MDPVLRTLLDAGEAVRDAVDDVKQPAEVVGIGADGKPTVRLDQVAEDAALEVLGELDARVVSEERGVIGSGRDTVVMDPLDGTGNAVRGVPFYSFSAACVGSAEAAAVVDLVRDDVFTYVDGSSRLNGREISVSDADDLSDATISLYTYGTRRGEEISYRVRRTRTLGSAALELCYVATGALDGMASLRGGLSSTDYAAGRLIVEGAGGVVEVVGEESLESVDRTVSLLAGPPSLVTDMGRWLE